MAWSRCWEAVEQASQFLGHAPTRVWLTQRTGRVPDVWVAVIVVDEVLVAERTGFRHVTSRWDLLAKTGLAGVAIITLGCLERVVRQMSADGFGRWVERAWLASGQNLLDQPEEASFQRAAVAMSPSLAGDKAPVGKPHDGVVRIAWVDRSTLRAEPSWQRGPVAGTVR